MNEPTVHMEVARLDEPFSLVATEEQSLLARARAGDGAAFESLVMPHRGTLLRVAQRVLRNREDAEDALQTAMFYAFRSLNTFQGRSRFSSWLTRIAMNAAFMQLRVRRRKRETSLDQMIESDAPARFRLVETRPNPEQECSAKEVRELLDRGLGRLGPLYIEVLHMHDVQELSAREAAQILGVPVGTVKARLHRARTKLVRHVQPMLASRRKHAMSVAREVLHRRTTYLEVLDGQRSLCGAELTLAAGQGDEYNSLVQL
jgi:RNA polymerase sigma-70 factor, ECF subfamily